MEAQAIRWAQTYCVGFVMSRLIYVGKYPKMKTLFALYAFSSKNTISRTISANGSPAPMPCAAKTGGNQSEQRKNDDC